jgi:hypothetical protein
LIRIAASLHRPAERRHTPELHSPLNVIDMVFFIPARINTCRACAFGVE